MKHFCVCGDKNCPNYIVKFLDYRYDLVDSLLTTMSVLSIVDYNQKEMQALYSIMRKDMEK